MYAEATRDDFQNTREGRGVKSRVPAERAEVGIQINHLGAGWLPLSVIQQHGSNPLRILPTRAVNSVEAPTFPLVPLPPSSSPPSAPSLFGFFLLSPLFFRILFSTRNVFSARFRFEWPNRYPTHPLFFVLSPLHLSLLDRLLFPGFPFPPFFYFVSFWRRHLPVSA